MRVVGLLAHHGRQSRHHHRAASSAAAPARGAAADAARVLSIRHRDRLAAARPTACRRLLTSGWRLLFALIARPILLTLVAAERGEWWLMGELIDSVFGVRLSCRSVGLELLGLLPVVRARPRDPAGREELSRAEVPPAARRASAGGVDSLAAARAAHAAQSALPVQHAECRRGAGVQPAEGGRTDAGAAVGPAAPDASRR